MWSGPDQVFRFDMLPKCACGRPSIGVLVNGDEETIGYACMRCGEYRVTRGLNSRAAYAARLRGIGVREPGAAFGEIAAALERAALGARGGAAAATAGGRPQASDGP